MASLYSQSLVNLLHLRELCHMAVGQQQESANPAQLTVIQKVSCYTKKSHALLLVLNFKEFKSAFNVTVAASSECRVECMNADYRQCRFLFLCRCLRTSMRTSDMLQNWYGSCICGGAGYPSISTSIDMDVESH